MIELQIQAAVQKLKAGIVSINPEPGADPAFWKVAADILSPLEATLPPGIFDMVQNRISVALACAYEETARG